MFTMLFFIALLNSTATSVTFPSSDAHQAWMYVLASLSIVTNEEIENKPIYRFPVDAFHATRLSFPDGSTGYETIVVVGHVVAFKCEKNE
jgi:hypothetical protein